MKLSQYAINLAIMEATTLKELAKKEPIHVRIPYGSTSA
ncbi:hypothetical protein PALU110988_24780 [Paenibacillus lupini]|nr:hypothetical protein [Paenibacillus lupini]